jgi:hypothetical protein
MTMPYNIPPKILYKYRSLKDPHTKCMIAHAEIYFATPDQLNDPLENFFSFSSGQYRILSEKEFKYIQPSATPQKKPHGFLVWLTPQERTRLFRFHIKNNSRGIFSFSENNKQISQYVYYADGFKGICIGVDWEEFSLMDDDSDPPQKTLPRKVSYLTNPPEISGKADEWPQVFTTKSTDFSFEKEWRMFYRKGAHSSPDVRTSIKQIIFGHNTSFEDRAKVKEWIKDIHLIEFFVTEPILGKFELDIKPYSFK